MKPRRATTLLAAALLACAGGSAAADLNPAFAAARAPPREDVAGDRLAPGRQRPPSTSSARAGSQRPGGGATATRSTTGPTGRETFNRLEEERSQSLVYYYFTTAGF